MTPAFWAHSALKTQCPFCLSGGSQTLASVRRKQRCGAISRCLLHLVLLSLLHSPSGKIRMGSLLLSWTCSVSLNRRVSKISRRDRRSQQQSTQHTVLNLQSPGTTRVPTTGAQSPSTYAMQCPHPREVSSPLPPPAFRPTPASSKCHTFWRQGDDL